MIRCILIYLFTYLFAAFIVLFLLPKCAFAFSTYDVDWPPSNEKGIHVLAITIDNCETQLKIKDKDFYSVTSNEKAMANALKKAIERASSGCKN